MGYVVLWGLCGMAAAVLATRKGRRRTAWCLLGVLLGPVALLVAVLPSPAARARRAAPLSGQAGTSRPCPFCAEAIRVEAITCRYCQRDVPPLTTAAAPGE